MRSAAIVIADVKLGLVGDLIHEATDLPKHTYSLLDTIEEDMKGFELSLWMYGPCEELRTLGADIRLQR